MTSIGRQEGEVAMVDLIQTDQRGAYADFDNRALSRDPRRVAVSNLPIIDLSPFMDESAREDRMHTARAVRSACINIGFFYVTGHGFTVKEFNAVLTQGLSFFALPLEEKMNVLSLNADMPGFVRTGGMDPEKNRDKVVDIKERQDPMAAPRAASGVRNHDARLYRAPPAGDGGAQPRVCPQPRSARRLFRCLLPAPGYDVDDELLPAGRSFQAKDHAVEFFAACGLLGLYGAAARLERRVAGAQFGRRVDRCDAEGRHLRCQRRKCLGAVDQRPL